MHITMITLGSRGDVQPYIALGKGFQQAGYSVRLITHAALADLVQDAAIPFSPLDASTKELFQTTAGQQLLEANGLRLLQRFAQTTRPRIWSTLERCWQACQGTDVIVSSLQGLAYGASLAEKLRLPLVVAGLQPIQLPTQAFADPVFSHTFRPQDQRHRLLNYVSHILAHAVLWEVFLPEINRARRRLLNLPPFPVWMPWQSLSQQADLLLLGYSPSVLPKPTEWNAKVAVTGYWFLDHQSPWQPPESLRQFLRAGPPPVYIGFGSMSSRHPERLTRLVLEALERSQQRGVLLTGWGAVCQRQQSAYVYAVESVPHDWLFPQVAAVVQHGGAGTIGASLRAGIPPITVSFLPEQAFWGEQAFRLGVSPRSMRYRDLTVQRLTQAIEQAVHDAAMRRRAAQIGQQIHAEQGVSRAIEMFEQAIVRDRINRRWLNHTPR